MFKVGEKVVRKTDGAACVVSAVGKTKMLYTMVGGNGYEGTGPFEWFEPAPPPFFEQGSRYRLKNPKVRFDRTWVIIGAYQGNPHPSAAAEVWDGDFHRGYCTFDEYDFKRMEQVVGLDD